MPFEYACRPTSRQGRSTCVGLGAVVLRSDTQPRENAGTLTEWDQTDG